MVNSQQIHMSVEDCTGVELAHLSISAPGTSPNTDGIHITHSKNVQVSDCTIKTGNATTPSILYYKSFYFFSQTSL
jgi:polygalacturonase